MGLGSLVLLAPALAAFASRTGRQTLLVTVAANRVLLDQLDWPVTPVYLRSESIPRLALDILRHGRRLRASRPAAVLDLEFYSAFTTLFGVPRRPRRHLLLDAAWRRGLATDAIVHAPDQHFADLARDVLSALAGEPLPGGLELPLRAPATAASSRRAGSQRRIVVNVNAGMMCLERRLPPPVFRDLLTGLAGVVEAEFHLIGDRREQAYTSAFAASLPPGLRWTCHAGHSGLPELVELLRGADLLISNDTGPMHLAAALGTPVLAVFGPESPARFGPRGGRSTVVWGRMECGPCLRADNLKVAPCDGDNRCLQQLTAGDLLPAAVALLQGGASGVVSVGPRLPPPRPCGVTAPPS